MMRVQATSFIKICRRLKASKHVKYQTEIPIIHVCLWYCKDELNDVIEHDVDLHDL